MGLKKAFKRIVDALFPRKCASCHELISEGFLCYTCHAVYMKEITDGCLGCGKSHPFCTCSIKHMEDERLIHCLPYKDESVSKAVLLRMKDGKYDLIAEELSDRLKAAMTANGIDNSWTLTFIPRAPSRIRAYGVDQTRELAYMLSRKTGLECIKTLKCRSLYREQKRLGLNARKLNAEKRFHLKRGAKKLINGKRILLLDDIVTSGASAKRCIELLREAGASDVICLAAGRSVKYL